MNNEIPDEEPIQLQLPFKEEEIVTRYRVVDGLDDGWDLLNRDKRYTYSFIVPKIIDESFFDYIHGKYFSDAKRQTIAEKIVFFIHVICRKTLQRERGKDDGYVQLSSNWLRNLLGSRYESPLKKALSRERVIEINPSYLAGAFSKGYKLSRKQVSLGFHELKLSLKQKSHPIDPKWHEKLSGYLASDDAVIRLTAQNLVDLTPPEMHEIDTSKLSFWKACCMSYRLKFLRENQIFCAFDDFGRFHSNFSNLDRISRKRCLLKNQPIFSVDIKACFPSLLLSLVDDKQEREKYLSWLFNDDFYHELMARDPRLTNRASVKIQFNSWVNGELRYREINRIMGQEFPTLYLYLSKIRQWNSAGVGHILMRKESQIMIAGALRSLWAKDQTLPLLPLHDAIYCTEENAFLVEENIASTFKEVMGFEPRIDNPCAV